MIISNLLQTNLEELILLSDEKPYMAIYAAVVAKKAYMEQDDRYDDLLSKAAIRVPSRIKLKEFIYSEIEFAEQSETVTAETIEPIAKTEQLSEITENIEIIAKDQIEEQVDIESIETVIEDEPMSEIVTEELSQTKVEEHIVGKQEIGFTGFGTVKSHYSLHREDMENLATEQDEALVENAKELIESADIEVELYEVDETEDLDVDVYEIEGLEEQITATEINNIEELIDNTDIEVELYEIDETDEIEVEVYELELDEAPVSSLSDVGEEQSMYKKIVNLLKEELADNQPKKSITQVVPVVVDPNDTVEFDQLQDEIATTISQTDTPEELAQDQNDPLDAELESLYAQAAYEAGVEQEISKQNEVVDPVIEPAFHRTINQYLAEESTNNIAEEQGQTTEPEIEIKEEKTDTAQEVITPIIDEKIAQIEPKQQENQLADSSQTHSFSGWLHQLSTIGADFAQDQKEHQERIQDPVQGSNNAYLKNAEEPEKTDVRPELTTRQVQELARKSMLPNKAYYTETLAYVYELQEKWSRAIEVYEQLSLQNPQKSSYFASQIKLLKEKLK